VNLRSTANLSTGGTATDVTDVIHPDNREMAVRAVTAIGLDVGGVDFLCPDIAESYKTHGGAICEVNAAPGFRMHVAPSEGTPRDVAGPVIDMLFPPGAQPRADRRDHRHQRQDHHQPHAGAHHKMAGYTPGLTTTDGVYIDGQRTVEGDMTGPVATRMVLSDPSRSTSPCSRPRAAACCAPAWACPGCTSARCSTCRADHLGLKGIDTLEELAEVKRIVVEVARDCAVLNADDPLVPPMSAHTEAKHLCYVTMNPQHALVREHIRAGGRACALESRRQRPDDHALRQGPAHPAAVDAPDPGDAGRPRHAQRAERDVRRRDGVLAWASSSTPSARACAPSTAPSSRRRAA
jgi:cyanophycin synthetase